MNYKRIAIFTAALGLLVLAIFSLSSDLLSPYVSIREAMGSDGKFVQIIGKLDKSAPVEYRGENFTFTIIDKDNTRVMIDYKGAKPLNFDHATNIVAVGKYKSSDRVFKADKLLLKCPSKYQKRSVQ